MVPLIHFTGMQSLEEAAYKTTWKSVWSAGQSVGLVNEIKSVDQIFSDFKNEMKEAYKDLGSLIDVNSPETTQNGNK